MEINFQQNGSLLLKACKLCTPSYQYSRSNFVFSGTVFERNRSTFKITLSFGIHTRNRFSPHKHVRVISNYERFLKGYTTKSSLASLLVWFWLGFFCRWCCLLFLLTFSFTASILMKSHLFLNIKLSFVHFCICFKLREMNPAMGWPVSALLLLSSKFQFSLYFVFTKSHDIA